jgi:predicted porin
MHKAAVIVALLVAAPRSAHALDTEVQVYGTFIPFVDSVRTSGATAAGLSPASGGATQVAAAAYTGTSLPTRFRLTSSTSNLGFRGSLKLSEQLKVTWQVESAVSPDGDAPNTLAGRNTGLGLATAWGTVLAGSWDTPYKFPQMFVTPLRGVLPFDNSITGNPGFGVPATTTQTGRASAANPKPDAAFNRRQGNSIQYWSPTWKGLSARVGVSLNEGKTVSSAAAPSLSPTLWSGSVSYDRGPLAVRYGYEQHDDYFGLAQLGGSAAGTATNRSATDRAHELVAWYTFPTETRLAAIYERLIYRTSDDTANGLRRYQRDAFYVLAKQRIGDHGVWGSFGQAGSGTCALGGGVPCTTNGLGSQQWSIGYTYSLAKTFDFFASYYRLDNGRSASYGVFPSPGTVAPGASTSGFGLGLLYTFSTTWTGSI